MIILYYSNFYLSIDTGSILLRVSPVDGHADQSVSDKSNHENHGVHDDEYPFGFLGRNIFDQIILIFLIRHVGRFVILGDIFRRERCHSRFPSSRHVDVSFGYARQGGKRDHRDQRPFHPHVIVRFRLYNTNRWTDWLIVFQVSRLTLLNQVGTMKQSDSFRWNIISITQVCAISKATKLNIVKGGAWGLSPP